MLIFIHIQVNSKLCCLILRQTVSFFRLAATVHVHDNDDDDDNHDTKKFSSVSLKFIVKLAIHCVDF